MKSSNADKVQATQNDNFVHANYEIRWKNFRRFEDTGWLTIRPITILIGSNNSGKSSLISPLLLLNQTLNSSDAETAIVTHGPLVDLGNFKDFVHLHEEDRQLFFGLRFHTHDPIKKTKDVGAYPPGAIEMTFGKGKHNEQLKLTKYEVFDIYKRPFFSRSLQTSGKYSIDGSLSFDKMTDQEREAILETMPVNFMFSSNSSLYQLNSSVDDDTQSKPTRFSEAFSSYLQVSGYSYSTVRSVFRDLSYIGPLRQRIERFYRAGSEMPLTVGPQGEYAASLYRRRKSDLERNVAKWTKLFEFGDKLVCKPLNDDLFQLLLKSGNEYTNLADVGFGASQVLPLIIQAMAAPEDSLTLAEQPEIHLNPRLQCVLADLFVYMAKAGHRVLVETHSEHLLTSLRRLVAQGDIDQNQIAIYFVERQGTQSSIREVPIDTHGGINPDSWPKGFFDDGLRESLALATAQAKSRMRM